MESPSVNIAILMLDDDHNVLELAEHVIQKLGLSNYKLFTKEEEFIDNLDDEIHVCVIDHRLTKFSGIDIVRFIKNKNSRSFVIIYTGYQNHDTTVQYIDMKIDGWVDKNKVNHLDKLEHLIIEGIQIAKERMEVVELLKKQMEKYA